MLYLWHNPLVTPRQYDSLSTAVHRKPTHTDLYLQWDSHHTIPSKYSMASTLHHRAKTICSSPQLLQQEDDHLFRVFTKCKYPAWALNRVKIKTRTPAQNNKRKGTNNSANNNRDNQKPYMVISYYKRLSVSLKRDAANMGYKSTSKEALPSRTFWWLQRTKIPSLRKVESSTDTNVTEWSVMRNILVNHHEHLEFC